MKHEGSGSDQAVYLGIEAGGTRTVALAAGSSSRRKEFGPANVRLLNDARLIAHFRAIAKAMPQPSALAIGMAGARTEADRERIRRAAAKAWPRVPCYATNDLETALMAAEGVSEDRAQKGEDRGLKIEDGEQQRYRSSILHPPSSLPRVLVLSGTGSCCFGRTTDGKTVKLGGWGHILGDKGSGYEIGLRALKAVVYYYDCDGKWPALGRRLLRALQLNEPNDLVGWVQNASKTEIAALAVEVFNAWERRDAIAADILEGAASGLAKDAVSCAKRLVPMGGAVQFVLAGSILLKQPRFTEKVARQIQRRWPRALITPLRRESAWGAVELARQFKVQSSKFKARSSAPDSFGPTEDAFPVNSLSQSPTEQRHPLSMNLDKLSIGQAIALMLREDEKVPAALKADRKKIERGVKLIVRSFKQGGRLFYVGAGTSGRLGVLDASECPPTFRTDPEMVQGIIAGGQTALWSAVEGAEDDPPAGSRAIEFRGISRRDTVVGIAASGRTPFVWGALREARRRGATTILLCFNPQIVIPRVDQPTLVIAPKIGPEILTGSTRLKAGTATKLILNIFTTLAMVRLGKVLGNLMIDVKASNTKLRDRAVRIVCELTGADYERAQTALQKAAWQIKEACVLLGRR
jgi:N-acetylmuramic acid 6-phosphate etherase